METTFQDLGLSEGLLQALNDAGYSAPTAIQEKAIPAVLMMRDVMGVAQTGTGKTAGFTLPMIDVLAEGQGRAKMPRSLILSPTRELAAQIAENFEKYGKIANVYIPRDRYTQQPRNFGFVRFYEENEAMDALDSRNQGVAALMCDTIFDTQGTLEAPDDYFKETYRRVRARGGLCIADEVQAGLGRTGRMWGFEH